jgi:hypothetical protein
MRIFGKNNQKILEHFTPLLFVFHVLMRIGISELSARKKENQKSKNPSSKD